MVEEEEDEEAPNSDRSSSSVTLTLRILMYERRVCAMRASPVHVVQLPTLRFL